MRYLCFLFLSGFLLGALALPGGIVSAISCSDIQNVYSSFISACQVTASFDDTSTNHYKNNHASQDDLTICILTANRVNVASYEILDPGCYEVDHQQTTGNLTVTSIRSNDCAESKYTTRASLDTGYCTNTNQTFTFDNEMPLINCCE